MCDAQPHSCTRIECSGVRGSKALHATMHLGLKPVPPNQEVFRKDFRYEKSHLLLSHEFTLCFSPLLLFLYIFVASKSPTKALFINFADIVPSAMATFYWQHQGITGTTFSTWLPAMGRLIWGWRKRCGSIHLGQGQSTQTQPRSPTPTSLSQKWGKNHDT